MQTTGRARDPQGRVTTALVIAAEPAHRVRAPQLTLLRRVGGVALLDRAVRVLREAG